MVGVRRREKIMGLWNELVLIPGDTFVNIMFRWRWEICYNDSRGAIKEILKELELEYCFDKMYVV